MLEIRKAVITLDEKEIMELQRIITDNEAKDALKFLRKSVYDQIAHSQQGRLKSHLDTSGDPVDRFRRQSY